MVKITKEEVLMLSDEELYPKFIEEVLSGAIEMEPFVEELAQTEKYKNSYLFRLHVMTAKQFISVSKQDYEGALDKADELIESSHVLKIPRLLNLNYHVMGIACKLLGYFEKAMECFMNILKYEKLYHLTHLTAMAYYYIGEIYLLHDDGKTAISYLTSGMEVLEKTKDIEPRYLFKKNLFSSNMVILLYETGQFDRIEKYVSMIREYSEVDKGIMSIYSYKLAELFFSFVKKDYEAGKKVFYDIVEMCGEDEETKLQQYKIFLALVKEAGLPFTSWEKELHDVENMKESKVPYINYYLNQVLFHYYEEKGEKEKALAFLTKAFQNIEKEMISLKKSRVNSFKLVEKAFAVFEDLSKETKENEKLRERNFRLEELSNKDGLTEISNRRNFEACILKDINKAREEGLSMAIFMFDVDNFKNYNDTYGHLEGDRILKTVALIIRDHFSFENGISARFGGEEFVAACVGKMKAELEAIGNKIREEIFSLEIENRGSELGKLSVSVGISYSKKLGEDAKYLLMREADNSLYQAKNKGKNNVVIQEIDTKQDI